MASIADQIAELQKRIQQANQTAISLQYGNSSQSGLANDYRKRAADFQNQIKGLQQQQVMDTIGSKGFNDLSMTELKQMKDSGLLDESSLNAMIKMQGDAQVKAVLQQQTNTVQNQFLNGKDINSLNPNERAELDRRMNDYRLATNPTSDGSPQRPTYNYITGLDGTVNDKFKLSDWKNVTPDTQALETYKKTALRDAGTASPWATMMLEKQKAEQASAIDNAATMGISAHNQAVSSLAQTGGINGGARERMARSSANNLMLDRQKAMRQGALDRMNIGLQDETQRMGQLESLQGMNNTQADIQFKNQQQQQGVNQFNIQNQFSEADKLRQYNLDTWKQQMQTWGANKTADAQAKAAGSGGGKK